MHDLLQDLRYALRVLRKSPGFTAVAVITLALGIGANTAIFSLVNAALLRPLPGVVDSDQLVTFKRLQLNNPDFVFGYPDFLDYHSQSRSFIGLAGHVRAPLSFSHGVTERIRGDLVSGDYFSLLGVKPALGRLIIASDVESPGNSPVVVLSYSLWQRAFGADSAVVGKTVQLNGHSFTVVGIAAREFAGTVPGSPDDVWLPLTMQPVAIPRMSVGVLQSRTAGWIGIFGRLRPGVSLESARAEAQTIAAHMAQQYPETNEHRGVDVIAGLGLDPDDRAALGKFLSLLLGAVGLLLLIACGNVAGLLLVRATSRRREIAIRLSIGATRWRLIRQLLTEGMLLSLLAGALGLVVAPWTASLILAFQQPLYAMTALDLGPDPRVLLFTLVVAVATGVLFGLVPALQASRPDLVAALKEGSPSSGRRRSRLQASLVSGQVALAMVLLVGAGLAVRTMRKVLSADYGFQTGNLVMLTADLSIQGYDAARGDSFYRQLLERAATTPGVEAATLAWTVPPNDFSGRISLFYEGQSPSPEAFRGHEFELGIRVDANTVATNFFRTMGIPLLAGRDFSLRDDGAAPRVAIVSQRLAQRLFPGQNPIGRRIEWPSVAGPQHPPLEIVGVAGDIKYRSLLAPPPLLIYLPLSQNYDGRETLLVRTSGDPAGVLPALRSAVAGLDPGLPVYGVKLISEQVANSLWQQRLAAGLIGGFGILALILAAIGLYGVNSHWVGQRTHEIGIRMALGARQEDILRLVLGQGLALAVLGVLIGVGAALATTRVMSGLLYGVSANDAFTFVAVSLLLIGVALGAGFIPARRATKVDPMVALHYE